MIFAASSAAKPGGCKTEWLRLEKKGFWWRRRRRKKRKRRRGLDVTGVTNTYLKRKENTKLKSLKSVRFPANATFFGRFQQCWRLLLFVFWLSTFWHWQLLFKYNICLYKRNTYVICWGTIWLDCNSIRLVPLNLTLTFDYWQYMYL